MATFVNDRFLNASIDRIQTLAALTLYGDNVELAIQMVVNAAHHYLLKVKRG